jgi:hypothetical protein
VLRNPAVESEAFMPIKNHVASSLKWFLIGLTASVLAAGIAMDWLAFAKLEANQRKLEIRQYQTHLQIVGVRKLLERN